MDMLRIWRHCQDKEGRSFFFNKETHVSTWDLPEGEEDWLECEDDESDRVFYHHPKRDISIWEHPQTYNMTNWIECCDTTSGQTFYYNVRAKKSVWEKPKGTLEKEKEIEGFEHQVVQDDYQEEEEEEEEEEEKHRSDSASTKASYEIEAMPEGEFYDYVLKEGGGSSLFGRKSWKRRFLVLKHGEIGFFRSYREYANGHLPLKSRWTNLTGYRLEEMLHDTSGLRLIPVHADQTERIWSFKCDNEDKKAKLIEAMSPFVSSKGFIKHLDRHLSGRRFLTDCSLSEN